MGRATRWLRNLLGLKKQKPSVDHHGDSVKPRPKCRWSFVSSRREREAAEKPPDYKNEKHAMAMAAATTAVAEAAIAAANAASVVVSLTNSKQHSIQPQHLAAIKIQSVFRGYLARRALRALRGLVRLQAIVRGHIERKKTAQRFRRMQVMLLAQSKVCAGRAKSSESSQSDTKSSQFHSPGPLTPEKMESSVRSRLRMGNDPSPVLKSSSLKTHSAYSGRMCEEDKILLEIDSENHRFFPRRRNLFHSSHLDFEGDRFNHGFSPYSAELRPMSRLDFLCDGEEESLYTAGNYFRRGSARTPTTSDPARSFHDRYNPNYMAYTESSKAKVRSVSAPKLRIQHERVGSVRRCSPQGYGEGKFSAVNASSLHANFRNKAYPGSCRLETFGGGICRY